MAYIGRDIEYGSLSKQSFVADSSTTSFSLNYDVASAMSLLVSVGGIVQEPDVGYTATGRTITFASAPISGDTVFIVFLGKELLVSNTTPQDAIDYQTMVGNGSNTLTLNHSVTNPQDLLVTYSGVNQKPGTDYTVSGTTLTFTTTPPTGMKVLVYFMALAGNTLWDGSVTNPKIVSMDAAKLTGTLPTSMSEAAFAPQYQDLSTLALHWASVDNKVAMNLTDDFIDHFQDDSGWVAYNGVAFAAGEIADYSTTGHAITKYGAVSTSTSIKKFGASSIHCTGSQNNTAHLHVASSDDWNFGTNDFTIEFWGRFNSSATVANIPVFTWRHPTSSTASSQLWYLDHGVGLKLMIKNDSGGTIVADQSVGSTDTGNSGTDWTHFALVRNGNTWTHYRNGTSNWSTTSSDAHVNHDGGITLIGENTTSTSWAMNGYFDDIRISNNARYTANFSVPTAAFTNDSNTLLLMNGDDRAAVTNTGSENVNRDTVGEYMAASTLTADPDNYFVCTQTTEANGSTTFTDSTGNETFSITNNTQWDTSQAKFGSSSIRQAGTGNYFRVEDNATLESVIQGTTWTMDVWLRTNGTPGSGVIFLKDKSSNSYNALQLDMAQGAGCRLLVSSNVTTWHVNTGYGGPELCDDAWHHVALVVNGSSWKVYVDGTEALSTTYANRPYDSSDHLYFGNYSGGIFDGWIQMPRLSTTAIWSSNFTPPVLSDYTVSSTNATGKVVSTTSTADSTVSKATGVMLYKDGEGTNTIGTDLKAYFSADDGSNWTEAASYGSPTTFDGTTKVIPLGETTMSNTGTAVKLKAAWANQQASSGTAQVITAVGDVQHSATQNKIGASSIYFDGTGDYLSAADHADFDFSGDFTAELWMYNTVSNSGAHLIGNVNHSSGAGGGWALYCNGTGIIKFNDYGNSINTGDTNVGWTANTWHHVAVTKTSNTVKLWLDGQEKASVAHTSAITSSNDMGIGSDGAATSSMYYNGYFDEIRISNTARYTANFTPSTTAFTTDADTLLLIHSDGVLSPNTTQSSTVDLWSGSTGSFTFSGNNVTATVGNRAIRTAEIAGDCKLEFTATTTNEIMCFGFYESSEDGSFNSTGGRGGMDAMTNSWLWRDEGIDRVGYGSNLTLADIPIADGDTVKLERISGEFKLHVNGSVVYTWTQQSTNPLRLCFAVDGPISNAVYTGVTWTGDINNIFTDSSPVSGKIAQLHGWAVNY